MNLPDESKAVIQLQDISLRRDHRKVLNNVNLTVNKGDFVAITGPNGGGKTTLLRIILGLLRPTAGRIWVDRSLSIGYLPQKNMIDSHFPISVSEVVESGLLAIPKAERGDVRGRVAEVLQQVGMTELRHRPIGELSGGQLQRALLGRAIISRPHLLALDEPLSYIDKRFEAHLYTLIEEISRHTTILLVSHEMTTIAAMANRHIIVDGTLHECHAQHHYVRSECDE